MEAKSASDIRQDAQNRTRSRPYNSPRAFAFLPCLAASRHNPVLRPLYLRLIAVGKAKKLALTALMRKLTILANHHLKNP